MVFKLKKKGNKMKRRLLFGKRLFCYNEPKEAEVMSNNATIRQHYIPQFILRNFVDVEGKISVFDKSTGKRFKCTPYNSACENHFYDFSLNIENEIHLLHILSHLAFCTYQMMSEKTKDFSVYYKIWHH